MSSTTSATRLWACKSHLAIFQFSRYAHPTSNTTVVDTSLFDLNNSYSKIFQLRFEQIPGKYWADDVTLFAVYDQKAQNQAGEEGKKNPSAFKIGYFYLGMFDFRLCS